jgi:hypothetical protein
LEHIDRTKSQQYIKKNSDGKLSQMRGKSELAKETKKMDHSKRDRFVKLAENRTRNAIKAIRTIAKLGNKSAYEFTEVDVKRIAGALSKEIDALKIRMLSTGGKETVEFKLD